MRDPIDTRQMLPGFTEVTAKAARDYAWAIGVVLVLIALSELFFGVPGNGLIVLLIGLLLLASGFRVQQGKLAPYVAGEIILASLLFGTLSITILSGARAVGVLVFLIIYVMLVVLLARRRRRWIYLTLCFAHFPLAMFLSKLSYEFPAVPSPDWVTSAHLRLGVACSIAALMIGMTYRRQVRHYWTLANDFLEQAREKRDEAAVNASRTSHFADSCSEVLWETDADSKLTFLSERFDKVFGIPRARCIGLTPAQVYQRLVAEKDFVDEFPRLVEERKPFRDVPITWITADKKRLHLLNSAIPISAPDGRFAGMRGVLRDNTIHRELQLALQELANTDELTGLYNREGFKRRCCGVLSGATAVDNSAAALAFVDLDNFKAVNDTCGHAVGDDILKTVARNLRSHCPDALVGRVGGDEFVVFWDSEAEQIVKEQSESVIASIAKLIAFGDGGSVTLGASIGLYLEAPVVEKHIDVWMTKADELAYKAKANGKGVVEFKGLHAAL